MLKLKTIMLVVSVSFASMGLVAEEYADFENKVFLIGQDKSLGKGYLSHDGLKLSSLNNDDQLQNEEAMVSAMFLYQDNRLKLAAASSDGFQRCLTNVGNNRAEFLVCDDTWSDQDFKLIEKSYKDGAYWIQNGDQCLTKAYPFELQSCSVQVKSTQLFTPSMVSTPVTYTIVNQNSGAQNVRMGFEWKNSKVHPHLFLKNVHVPGKQSVSVLVPDYTAYGLQGNPWFYNETYSYEMQNLGDHKAGDLVAITMPRRGSISTISTTVDVPAMVAKDGTTFRVADVQGAVAIWHSRGIESWVIPEGWILNVYPSSNFQGEHTQLTSTSEEYDVPMPTKVGSIAIEQKAGHPIRMRNESDGNWRQGELVASTDHEGFPAFFRSSTEGDLKSIGPVYSGQDSDVGLIRAVAERFDFHAKTTGYYMRKRMGSSHIPFTDRAVWEPLNIGSWLNHGKGLKGELYYTFNTVTDVSHIWILKQNGAGHQCLPLNGDDQNWFRLGIVYGKIDSDDSNKGVLLYTDKEYEGNKVKITEDIADLCHMNEKVSSYKIPKGWEVEFYTGKHFTGNKYTRSSDSTTLGGFDNRIQSIKITKRN